MTVAISVFCSGRGTGFEAISRAIEAGALDARITSVVTDRPGAPVIERARSRGLRVHEIAFPERGAGALDERRASHDRAILEALSKESPRFVVMAGYMRIVSPVLLEAFAAPAGYHRIVNVHPSLLPAFPGTGGYAQAFRHGCQISGATVHLVDPGLDSGPICAQESFSIAGFTDESEVERRGLELEHRLYPGTLAWVLPERFKVETRTTPAGTRRLCVRPH